MTEKRFTYDSKTVSILKDGEFWLDGNIDTACNHSEICNELNKLTEENEQLKKENKELRSDRDSYHKNIVSGINDYIKDHTIKVDKLPVYGNDKLIYQLPNKLQYLYFRKKWECIGEVEKELEK